jgi:hypothetical protein
VPSVYLPHLAGKGIAPLFLEPEPEPEHQVLLLLEEVHHHRQRTVQRRQEVGDGARLGCTDSF